MAPPVSTFVSVTVTLSGGASANRLNFGSLIGIFDHSATANRIDGPYAEVSELDDAGFTAAAEPEVNAWATAALTPKKNGIGVKEVYVGRKDAGDANWTATMTAVEAAATLAGTDWYITNVETRAEADILLVAAWVEARRKIYIAQTEDAAVLAGTAGNVMLDLETAGYLRTAAAYHALSVAADGDAPAHGYLDGSWSGRAGGFDLDAPGGAGIWAFKVLNGQVHDTFSTAQTTAIYGANGNVYGSTEGLAFTSKGTMASGRFIDVTTSMDWLAARSEAAILEALVGEPIKIPNTNAGRNKIRAAGYGVITKGIAAGHLSPDHQQRFIVPDAALASAEERASRELTVSADLVLAGGIQRVVYTIRVVP